MYLCASITSLIWNCEFIFYYLLIFRLIFSPMSKKERYPFGAGNIDNILCLRIEGALQSLFSGWGGINNYSVFLFVSHT